MTTLLDTSSSLRAARSLAFPQTAPTKIPPCGTRSRVAASISPAQAVQAAAHAFSRNALHPASSPGAGAALHPRALLAVLTYCYASEIYSSTDIEDLMLRDAAFRSLCGDQIPDAGTLRRFRRHNHEAIETCLYAALRSLADQAGNHSTDVEIHEEAHQHLMTVVLMDVHEI